MTGRAVQDPGATKPAGASLRRDKKPELVQDQAQVVTGTAEQHVDLVALGAFQVVASQQPIGFQVTDHRRNRLATFERAFQALGRNAALLC